MAALLWVEAAICSKSRPQHDAHLSGPSFYFAGAIYIDPDPGKDLFVYADTVRITGNNGVLAKYGNSNGRDGARVSIVARKLICGELNCAIDTSGMLWGYQPCYLGCLAPHAQHRTHGSGFNT